jgi:DNA polymerase III epsilon subunit family exonuclease
MTWVSFDTETTGLNPGSRLVELAAIAFDDQGAIQDTFTSVVNPGMPIPPDASAVHGIDDVAVAGGPDGATVLSRFMDWLPRDAVLIGHNSSYDQGIVTWECQRFGLPLPAVSVVDTCAMARKMHVTENCRLEVLVAHHGLTLVGEPHRALPDADAARQLFLIARVTIKPVLKSWSCSFSYPQILPDHLRDLPNQVAAGKPISFNYRNGLGKASKPTVIPYGWAETCDKRLLIHGLHTRMNSRIALRADRIECEVANS